jgi:L-threonylcarbamoyladenylate synthase
VLYPTETLYGLGGRAGDAASALRIASMKGRPPGGLIVLIERPPLEHAASRALAAAFWPGPLTLVVPAWPELPAEVRGPDQTVAVRPPIHPAAVALVRAVGPITSTSANLSGAPPLLDPRELLLPVDAIVDVGPLPPSAPSSLVCGRTGRILREGAIPAADIARVLAGERLG